MPNWGVCSTPGLFIQEGAGAVAWVWPPSLSLQGSNHNLFLGPFFYVPAGIYELWLGTHGKRSCMGLQ